MSASTFTDYWQGNEYSKHSNLQLDVAKEIFKRCPLKSTDNVLDIGCGDGKITLMIAKQCFEDKVVSVDPSKGMLNHARSAHSAPNLEFITGFAETVNVPEVKFDYILSCCALHWAKDLHKCLLNLQRFLKPDGKICINVDAFPSYAAPVNPFLHGAVDRLAKQEEYKKYLENFDLSETLFNNNPKVFFSAPRHSNSLKAAPSEKQSFEAAPLDDFFLLLEEFTLKRFVYTYENTEGFVQWSKQWRTDLLCIPAELQEKYLQDFAKVWEEMNKEYNKKYGYPENAAVFSLLYHIATYIKPRV